MKKSFNLVIILATFFFVASCQNPDFNAQDNLDLSKSINLDNVFSNSIGFLNEQGNFENLNESNFSSYYLSNNSSENYRVNSLDFEGFTLTEDFYEGTENRFYALSAHSTDDTISLTYLLEFNDGGDLVVQGSCECKTKDCASNWGCNASTGGGLCSCSHCTGDCEKTTKEAIQ
jgi:hypothetical protein